MQNEYESTDIIRIEHLNKTFGDVKAVRDLGLCEKRRTVRLFRCERCRKKHDNLHSLRTVIEGQRNGTDQRNR